MGNGALPSCDVNNREFVCARQMSENGEVSQIYCHIYYENKAVLLNAHLYARQRLRILLAVNVITTRKSGTY